MLVRLLVVVALVACAVLVGNRLVFAQPTVGQKQHQPAVYTAETAVTADQRKEVSVSCPAGQVATGGGGWVTTAQAQTFIDKSVPLTTGGAVATNGQVATGWQVSAIFDLIVTNNWALRVYVICV